MKKKLIELVFIYLKVKNRDLWYVVLKDLLLVLNRFIGRILKISIGDCYNYVVVKVLVKIFFFWICFI